MPARTYLMGAVLMCVMGAALAYPVRAAAWRVETTQGVIRIYRESGNSTGTVTVRQTGNNLSGAALQDGSWDNPAVAPWTTLTNTSQILFDTNDVQVDVAVVENRPWALITTPDADALLVQPGNAYVQNVRLLNGSSVAYSDTVPLYVAAANISSQSHSLKTTSTAGASTAGTVTAEVGSDVKENLMGIGFGVAILAGCVGFYVVKEAA